nr:hypothetical protein [Tanacetum cinerariifolium]
MAAGKFNISSSSSLLYTSGKRGSMERSSSFWEKMENPILSSLSSMSQNDLPPGLLKGKLPSSSPEDLKRLKAGLRESTIKARERVKVFSERVEERRKNSVPNKWTRTSMVDQKADVRPNTPARSSGCVERDKKAVRLPNGNALQGADRTFPVVGDGWEKAKMKKKRRGIKPDTAPSSSSVSAKPIDGSKEPKQGIHTRNLPDARSRTYDPYEFRLGVPKGGTVSGKADVISTQTGIGMRSSISRPEQENASFFLDKRDQINLDQDGTNVRTLNRANVPEDFISGTPSSTRKLYAAARGPRSESGVIPKLSQVQRTNFSNGLESPHGTRHGSRRRYLGNSLKQFKSKGSSTLSESEESEAAEIRSRDNKFLNENELTPGVVHCPFWKLMDPLFRLVPDAAIAYVKKERLLIALISEEDNNDDLKVSVYVSSFEPKTNVESDAVNRRSLQNFELDGSN